MSAATRAEAKSEHKVALRKTAGAAVEKVLSRQDGARLCVVLGMI